MADTALDTALGTAIDAALDAPLDPVPEIVRLDPAGAIARLRTAPGGGRGFLGLDPVTQNDALLRARLATAGAQLFGCGDAVLGYAPNPDNSRQATVASTSSDPGVLAAFTAFLGRYRRHTAFVCYAAAGDPVEAAVRRCGWTETGRLRDHVFRTGRYHDLTVYCGGGEPCSA